MATLEQLRAEKANRYALLPEGLRGPLERQRDARRMKGTVLAAALVLAGGGVAWFEYAPPLSFEETEFVCLGLLAMLLAVPVMAYTWLVDPALAILVEEDIVWAKGHAQRGAGHFLMFHSDRGLVGEVRLDADMRYVPEREQHAMAALRTLHPDVHLGDTPALTAAYARSPASLRRSGAARPQTPWTMLFRARFWILGIACAVLAMTLMFVLPMLRLMSMR